MNIVTLDFETYFADDFTLAKMTTESYVRDPRFEVHGCAVRLPFDPITGEGPAFTQWADAPNLHYIFDAVDWNNTACLCHHAQFDGLILSHHFGIRPKYWLCSLTMARQQLGNHLSVSLDNVRQHFGLPLKRTPYEKFKNKHWHELTPQVQQELAAGAGDEVESIYWLFANKLSPHFPPALYPWVDNTIRMFTEPRLVGDMDLLVDIWREEVSRKQDLLTRLNMTAKDLGSDETFANLLREYGIEPETKDTGKQIKYAFAKTDPQMQELADDEDDDVRALVEARLSIKSTLQQTRSERIGYMASRGPLCIYIHGFGAHTNRDSGGDKLNWQNVTRKSRLHKAVRAPAGQKQIKVDKSQIECRLLNAFAGQWDVLERFRNKEDPYTGIASQFYGHEVYKPEKGDPRFEEMETKRGTGKQLELSCGYGAGGPTIVHTARKGTYGPPVYLTADEGERAKVLYRDTHQNVVQLWRDAGRMISAIGGTDRPVQWGCVEVRSNEIILPNGAKLRYPELEYHNEATDENPRDGNWRYRSRKGRPKLYGAKLVENLIQALAWVAFQEDICRIGLETGLWPVRRDHDAGTWLVPDDGNVEQWRLYLKQEMSRPPAWMPDAPLDADAVVLD